jgi:heme exporter protein A
MNGAFLRLEDVACVRGGRMLLAGVNLSLAAGESAVLRGPNGIGKSSLIRAVAGLLPVYAGRVSQQGAMALCDEALALEMQASLGRALGFWAQIDGVGPGAVDAALEALDLTRLADVPVRMLSTGQRKRAVLARVVASGAPIWLLDEPGNGLDNASVDLLGAIMARHLTSGGVILAASHQALPVKGATDFDVMAWRPLDLEA